MKRLLILLCSAAALSTPHAQQSIRSSGVEQIRAEMNRGSQVLEYAFQLTDVHGPRLSGSPSYKAAGEWVIRALQTAGISNPRAEPLSDAGQSWSYRRFSVHLVTPQTAVLTGMPYPWSRSTRGRQVGTAVLARLPPIQDSSAVESFLGKHKGSLRNTVLLAEAPRAIRPSTTPMFRRYTDSELAGMTHAVAPTQKPASSPAVQLSQHEADARRDRVLRFLSDEGVIAIALPASGDGGTVFLAGTFGDRRHSDRIGPPALQLAPESYNRLARLVERGVPVQVEVEIDSQFHRGADHFSVFGELNGGSKTDEVVIIGAHLDSWHGGTGATDNAVGVAIVMEAMRLLAASGLPLERTVRIALWGGHEINGQGSRQYIEKHYKNARHIAVQEGARLCCYFNVDYGAGKIRGLYTQGNERWAPLFGAWLAPF
jgi:carboxypeptidase Q